LATSGDETSFIILLKDKIETRQFVNFKFKSYQMKLKALILVCIATLFIQSCTTNEQIVSKSLVQKRKYLKGWNLRNLNQKSFEIAGKQLKKNKNYPTRLHENLASQLELLALVNNELLEHTRVGQMAEPNPALQSNRVDTSSCDILILQNGVELEVKVSEISDELIKFKMCDNLNGPQISKKSKMFT